MLTAIPVSLAAVPSRPVKRVKPLPATGEFVRFSDPTTETIVVRLTNPATTSLLPAATNRFVSAKERFLVFSSDRTGTPTPFQIDLRTGIATAIVKTKNLHPDSMCLDEHGKFLYLLDGTTLQEITLANRKIRTLAEDISAFSAEVPAQILVVRGGRLEGLNDPESVLAEDVEPSCLVRPGGGGCLFERQATSGREFWYVPTRPDAPRKPVLLAKGRVSNPFWSPQGESLLILRDVPVGDVLVSEIHEIVPETGAEQCVARTSQFAAFAPNGDGSVYVGASRSKAQPTVILLVRSVRRELTLCEHRASHPVSVSPVFSPDSRRVYFQSDHQGKSALYSVNVELLVEPTPGAI